MPESTRRKWERWPGEFKRRAVERMKNCENVSLLAEELGVARVLLYRWRRRAEVSIDNLIRCRRLGKYSAIRN